MDSVSIQRRLSVRASSLLLSLEKSLTYNNLFQTKTSVIFAVNPTDQRLPCEQ
jgi:hypothetical protein